MTAHSLPRVVLWMSGALFSFSAMAVSIRMLAGKLSVFEILSIRSASGLAILVAALAVMPRLRAEIGFRRVDLHLLRNTVHWAAQFGWAWCVTVLPLATAFAIEFTTPAWVALFAVAVLGERLTPSRVGAVVLGFLGVVVILRPGLALFQPATLVMLVVAMGFGVSITTTKKLTAHASTFAILFWMNAMQLPMNLTGADPGFLGRLAPADALPVAAIAVTGLSAHLCLTNAFRWGDATIVTPLDFLRIPLIAVVGWQFYGEPFDPFVFLGAGLIVAGILWNLRAESRGR